MRLPTRRLIALATTAFASLAALSLPPAATGSPYDAGVRELRSSVPLRDGSVASVLNHLSLSTESGRLRSGLTTLSTTTEFLVVWAGDWNLADRSAAEIQAGTPVGVVDAAVGPDFLAIIGANGADKGKVVNTVTVDGVANEPHHMQYTWNAGDRIYAGGLFSDRTFVFDVSQIPLVTLAGVNEPYETPCGSVPDAYWVLSDGTAYGTYMGGPDAAGDPRCNGGINNGFAGTPGTIVHLDTAGATLGEFSAASTRYGPASHWADDARPDNCPSNPPIARPSCANPHGIQAREDLGFMITSDYAEPRNVPTDPVQAIDPHLFRDTVRIWRFPRAGSAFDTSRPLLHSVIPMPLGAMAALPPGDVDARGFMGIMETTVTHPVLNSKGKVHKGAFASSMCGGAIYYTADFTVPNPMWRQVFEATAAARKINPDVTRTGCAGAGWIQTSPDDKLLFSAVIGRNPGTFSPADPGMTKMVYALDISTLVDVDSADWVPENLNACSVDTIAEAVSGGSEPTCPTIAAANVVELGDTTSGGPHWGAIDNFTLGAGGAVTRIASSNYFVARAGIDGNHKVCMISVASTGALTLDATFMDQFTNEPCVDFDRASWPHGHRGKAKPHSMLFVIGPGWTP